MSICHSGTFLFESSATAAVEFGIDASHRGPEIGKLYYGIFFEEINHAGNGGIYAELVRNRSFEDNMGILHNLIVGLIPLANPQNSLR